MDSDAITLVIAIWGAFTGTVAIALNVLRFRRDRPDIKISPAYKLEWNAPIDIRDFPPDIRVSAPLANTGQRPATLLAVVITYRRKGLARIFDFVSAAGRYEWKLEAPLTLAEGGTAVLEVPFQALEGMKEGRVIHRLSVIDTAEGTWTSKGSFGELDLTRIATATVTEGYVAEGEVDSRRAVVKRVCAGRKCAVYRREEEYGSHWPDLILPFVGVRKARHLYKSECEKADAYVNGEQRGFVRNL